MRVRSRRFFCSNGFDRVYVHPRNTRISAKIGKAKDAQSKIRTAISRFVRRRTNLVPSVFSLPFVFRIRLGFIRLVRETRPLCSTGLGGTEKGRDGDKRD